MFSTGVLIVISRSGRRICHNPACITTETKSYLLSWQGLWMIQALTYKGGIVSEKWMIGECGRATPRFKNGTEGPVRKFGAHNIDR